MNRVTITLTIDLPEGVVPDVGYSTVTRGEVKDRPKLDLTGYGEPEPPLPAAPPPDLVAEAQRVFEQAPRCPQHGDMRRFPPGVSKKSGKPFNASWRCQDGCETKPIWDKDAA